MSALLRAIAAGDAKRASRLLKVSPGLASEPAREGATRASATAYFLRKIGHYVYAGDTALHVAAAAHQRETAESLVRKGANVRASKKRCHSTNALLAGKESSP